MKGILKATIFLKAKRMPLILDLTHYLLTNYKKNYIFT